MLGHESRHPQGDRIKHRERQPIVEDATLAAAEHLARCRRDVRFVSGAISVDGMAMTAKHVRALARARGWDG